METQQSATFEPRTTLDTTTPTLIEGLPGLGLVASIAVDQVTEQLQLEQHGTITSEAFPPIAAFQDGRVRDAVRVYAGADPDVLTLQSDLPIPESAFKPLTRCVLDQLALEFDRAIFLAGIPAESEEEIGEVLGVATTDTMKADIVDAGIELAEGAGLVGGVTGALVTACYHADVPAALLLVRANPYIPDPAAARAVIENALEPLVDFDIDTSGLQEQADQIQQQKQQIAQQLKELQEREQPPRGHAPTPSMYQ